MKILCVEMFFIKYFYSFSATFWHIKNAEQHVGRFLAHPNVLLKEF